MKTLWGYPATGKEIGMRPVTRSQPMSTGHTAYHHLGLGECLRSDLESQPSPSSPYYLFGLQPRRYPYMWYGNSGGIPQSRVAAESRGLGIFDLLESGLEPIVCDTFLPYPAFKNTQLHNPIYAGVPPRGSERTTYDLVPVLPRSLGNYVPSSDWPLVRPAGYEPDDPHGDGLGFSDNEKKLGLVLAAAAIGWLVWKKMGKAGQPGSRKLSRRTRAFASRARANPVRKRYWVKATASRRARRLEYAGSFTKKSSAVAYAESLRKGGHKAQVVKNR